MVCRLKLLSALFLLLPVQVLAQEDVDAELIDLLEFLGEFDAGEGVWISPEELMQDIYNEPAIETVSTDSAEIDDEDD